MAPGQLRISRWSHLYSWPSMGVKQKTVKRQRKRGANVESPDRFSLQIRVWPHLAINRSAASEKCKITLERSHRVEQAIPRHPHPPSPLFGRKSTEKGPKRSFRQGFRTAAIRIG
ncbi:unnamed protein product, partial [Sphacelaria rigidula]